MGNISVLEKELSSSPQLSTGMTFAMAVSAGLAVANIYYNQPMLGILEQELPGSLTAMVPTATQLGYAIGLFALVPLGDLVERRRIIITQFAILTVMLVAAALAPSAAILLIASFFLGMASTVAQQIVPFAAQLAEPGRRGAVVGTVMSGVLCGILLSRTLSGFVASHYGWRAMFWLGVPLALIAGGLMACSLPKSAPSAKTSYVRLMGSIIHLWREFSELRTAAVTQALLFGSFTVFWTVLALRLEEPMFGLNAQTAGLFGIIGATGVLAAPFAGRIADSQGPYKIILGGTLLTLISWVLFGFWTSVAGLVVGCILLDFAVQSVLVSNQHIVYALRPEARSRLNTVFMGAMFLGGALGSAAATLVWGLAGWTGVSLLGGIMAIVACAVQWLTAQHRRKER
ncbi:MFS transporter [uncultured Cedecea sp.]|uniref:MFS transporter n=1 Tax=uncultured Cedecea sp. TaxID=988762 RepID=UPI00260FCC48|nr:MFS transporter [uncultured Cedecea sp.]